MDYASIYADEAKGARHIPTKRLMASIEWRLNAKRFSKLHALGLDACLDADTDVLMKRGICADVVARFKGAGAAQNGGK